jgi:hypothetical protein
VTQPDLRLALEGAARQYLLDAMGVDATSEAAALDLRALASAFFNWRARLIPARPRNCHLSRELEGSEKATEHRMDLDALVAEIVAGADLTSHLSKKVATAYQAGGDAIDTHVRDDRDLLLAEWGVYHLHLAQAVGEDGFVTRANDLIFAMFAPNDAYLIGIYGHGSWGLTEVLEIVVRHWPDAKLMLPTHAIGLTQKFTGEERLQLRKAGVASPMIEVDGKVWVASALGQTLDGKASRAGQRAMGVMWTLSRWEDQRDALLAEAEAAVNEAAGRLVTGEWTAIVHEGVLGLLREDLFHPVVYLRDAG